MAQQINVNIRVRNQPISPFSTLTINQQFNGHHYFELRFNNDVLEQANAFLINKSKDFLGENITITFSTKHASSYPDNVFIGVITEIDIINDINSSGDLVFKGYSPTILMESGEHNASFSDKNLSQIIKTATGNITDNVQTNISPAFKSSIPFVVQYRESNFEFARRLAAEYGEWFFYDGSKFNFGKPSSSTEVALKYPRDITNLSLQVKVAPSNFERTGYYSKDDKKYESASSSQSASGLDAFGSHAQSASNRLFRKPANALANRPTQSKNELDALVTAQKSAQAARMVCVVAGGDSPYLKLGSPVSISALRADKSPEDFGKFVITSIVHSTDGLGNYHNVFEGIPASLSVVPNPFGKKPVAEPQLGVVKNNEDPDNLGKVKVQLLWQKDNETTPYIRVMMPHAGMRNGNKKNRGAFFTPEVDDYVIVGFTQNDPDRPFVMGSVPHGKAINTSMNSDNNAKAIRTRSGNTIYFFDNESKKEQEVRIETDDNNFVSILLQNGKGTIKIHSTDTIDVKSDKVVNVTSKDIHIKATNDITMEANSNITIKANKKIEMHAQQVKVEADQSLQAKGMEVKIEGSATTSVKGSTQLDLNGGAMANLKAGIVKIN